MESNIHMRLDKKPKSPKIIIGYPGFGMVSSIAVDFMVQQLACEPIGRITFKEMPSLVIIEKTKIIDPIRIFHEKTKNMVFVQVQGVQPYMEWYFVQALLMLSHELKAQEIITLEGIFSQEQQESFFFSTKNAKAIETKGCKPIEQGMVVGVSGLLLSFRDEISVTSFFAKTMSGLPDSKAAVSIIQCLSDYIGFEIDYKPLAKQGEAFERKLKDLLEQTIKAQKESDQKRMSYVG
jgi:uncharacterized protein